MRGGETPARGGSRMSAPSRARQGRLTREGGCGEAQQQERGARGVGHDCAALRAGRGRRLSGVWSSELRRDASHSRRGSGGQGRTAGTPRVPSGWCAAGSNFSLLKINFSFGLNNRRLSKMLQNEIPVTPSASFSKY